MREKFGRSLLSFWVAVTVCAAIAFVWPVGSRAPAQQPSSVFDVTPTPRPPGPARLIATLILSQGDAGDRTALFEDGTLIHAARFRERTVTSRKRLTSNETDVIRHICEASREAWEPSNEFRSTVFAPGIEPRILTIEVGESVFSPPRSFQADDLRQIPLALGRIRGALLDLRERFYSKRVDEPWDAALPKGGEILRRRFDGRLFLVARNNEFDDGVELEDRDGLYRLKLTKAEVTSQFAPPGTDTSTGNPNTGLPAPFLEAVPR